MLSACQLDARQRRRTCTVEVCEPIEDGLFDVILDDTVLYAEGGGQPADRGTLDGEPVLDVQKGTDGRPRHRLARALAVGSTVDAVVDWDRRWDHMQQHTGQHLLTAVIDQGWGRATVGFHLGAESCTIDLDGPIRDAERAAIEAQVQAEILADRPVSVAQHTAEELDEQGIRSRGLPEGLTGPIRVVTIAGLDHNTCGGTHVGRTGELQLLHITKVEKVRGGARLSFVVGSRALALLQDQTARSHTLTALLRCAPEAQGDRVKALIDETKAAAKALRAVETELTDALGRVLAQTPGQTVVWSRPTADLGMLRGIAQHVRAERPDRRVLLTGDRVFLLHAPEAVVLACGPAIADLLGGRGGGRGTTHQGRSDHISPDRLATARNLLETFDAP